MNVATAAPSPHALYPLSALDVLFEKTTFVTGWLVHGTLDATALADALARVTEKWRMLAGRLHSRTNQQTKTEWFIRIPLGPLPAGYRTFSLTTTVSAFPLNHYVPIPFEQVTQSFPPEVFLHPSTPRKYLHWEGNDHPLTCWHLTYFPADANNGQAYTCIGFARCHGIFDGGGASLVMRAVVAEMNRQEWNVPPLPLEGVCTNPVKECIEEEVRSQELSTLNHSDYAGFVVLGLGGVLRAGFWHTREKLWRGAQRQIILFPKSAVTFLVESVRDELRRSGKRVETVTTGDILTAWIFKTVYSEGTSPDTIVNCCNLGSYRHLLPLDRERLELYPHNAFAPLPYPIFSVADLNTISLPDITYRLNAYRNTYSLSHVGQAYKLVTQSVTTFLGSPHADENLFISNVSASRILESDWTAIGGAGTICGYRYQVTPHKLLLTNSVYIAGRLDDGSTVLDVTLNKYKVDLLVREIRRISAEAEGKSQ